LDVQTGDRVEMLITRDGQHAGDRGTVTSVTRHPEDGSIRLLQIHFDTAPSAKLSTTIYPNEVKKI